ncbi:hypothetical protein ANOM_004188 [Aspergillus nomiae NRRL 13137]|uniref:F-box domain-containing protein n=1 Tax=Aspergillus nomiae NRRL (strain ATCC 15546 / NRRL 13137 / CBS 260.88 / M93) TaxID=1509407 RepID=A0A0L1J5M9_ASPN3|nr:uncharacterized protein ANOM_004188 [Aspergillus nomiae NRRL 13137]KNG86960.1 hypothetical protein ANOM_004188 [Aspergillus nomiae NRRL 13137]
MGLGNLPREILSLIIGLLIDRKGPFLDECDNLQHICNARLVCRLWNTLATAHVFHTVTLAYTDGEYQSWNDMLASDVVRQAVRCVYIRSAPADDHPLGIWHTYTDCGYDGLISAIGRIAELDRIQALHLRFSRHCGGVETDDHRDEVVEDISTRQEILESVFKAIHKRSNNKTGAHPIRSLTVENLQNAPLPDFTSSELFRGVTKDIDTLHLMVAEEYDEAGPDWDTYRIERQVFEPYLHRQWLAPLADHLVCLTLSFQVGWGTIPGYFDGSGLHFPRLKTLNLGNFVIGHHAQFDWVLNQSSLVCLRLDRCSIVSHITTHQTNLEEWHVQTHDWHEYPIGSFGIDGPYVIYGFSGTWEAIFDNICTRLPNLKDFCFHYGQDPLFPVCPEILSDRLTKQRYTAFDDFWHEADEESGLLDFGDSEWGHPDRRYVNRSKETEMGDGRALDALLQKIRERQQR